MRILFSPLLICVLSGLLAAQEPTPQPAPEPRADPLLEARAGTTTLLDNALIQFEPDEDELPEDGAFHVILTASGELRFEVAEDDPGILWVRASPARLLETYREDLGVVLGVMRGIATMGLIQQGVPSKEAIGFFETLVEAPKQVRELELSARETGPGIVEVDLFLRPTHDTWLAEVCAALEPLPEGAPVLREANALVSLAVAVDPEVLPVLLEPFHALSVAMLARDPEERERLRCVLQRATGQADGSLAMSVDEHDQRITQMIGIRDVGDYRRLRETEDYELLLQRMMRGGGLMHFKRVPDALEHRGVHMTRSAMQLGRLGVPEGVGETRFLIYTGLVGDRELTVRFDPDHEEDGLELIRDLVDRTLDGQIRRMPIPDGALLRVELDLRPTHEFLVPFLGTLGIRSDPPIRATLEARRGEPGLHLHVTLVF